MTRKRFFYSLLLAAMAHAPLHAQQDSIGSVAMKKIGDSLTVAVRQDSLPRKRVRINGFRVQVYYGGNNHQSKLQAQRMAERAKIWFEEYTVYTRFASPHWICRVGDFRTREEASVLLQAMKESGRFPMAVIVKSKVNVYVNEQPIRTEQPDSCATGDSTACKANPGTPWGGPHTRGTSKDSITSGESHDRPHTGL